MGLLPSRTNTISALQFCAVAVLWIVMLSPSIHAIGDDTANKVLEGTTDFLAQRIQDTTIDWFITEIAAQICEEEQKLEGRKQDLRDSVELLQYFIFNFKKVTQTAHVEELLRKTNQRSKYFRNFCAYWRTYNQSNVASFGALAAALRKDVELLPVWLLVESAQPDLPRWVLVSAQAWWEIQSSKDAIEVVLARISADKPKWSLLKQECADSVTLGRRSLISSCWVIQFVETSRMAATSGTALEKAQALCIGIQVPQAKCDAVDAKALNTLDAELHAAQSAFKALKDAARSNERRTKVQAALIWQKVKDTLLHTRTVVTTVCRAAGDSACNTPSDTDLVKAVDWLNVISTKVAKLDEVAVRQQIYAMVPTWAEVLIDLARELRAGNVFPSAALAHVKSGDEKRWTNLKMECLSSSINQRLRPACWLKEVVEISSLRDLAIERNAALSTKMDALAEAVTLLKMNLTSTPTCSPGQTSQCIEFTELKIGVRAVLNEFERTRMSFEGLESARKNDSKNPERIAESVFQLLGNAINLVESGCRLDADALSCGMLSDSDDLERAKQVMLMLAAFASGKSDEGIHQLLDYMAKYERDNDSFDKAKRYLVFVSDLAAAKTSTEVKTAIQDAAAPKGAWRLKRQADKMFSIGALGGGYYGRERIFVNGRESWTDVAGPFAPIGFDFSYKMETWTIGLFASVLDLGSAVSERINTDSDSKSGVKSGSKLTLAQAYAPGLFLRIGVGRSPIVLGYGEEYRPRARVIAKADGEETIGATQKIVFVAIDIVILPFGHLTW